jgi:hypothetical protein
MMRRLAILAAGVAAAMGLSAHPAKAQTQVACESFSRDQRVCAMDTTGGVQLVRTHSQTPCIQGQTWGVTRGGVWVSGGCRATFATVGASAGSGRYGTYDRYGRNNGSYDNGSYNNGNTWNNNELATANNLCRQALRQRLGNRRLSTSLRDSNRNSVRLNWASSNGHSGTCRVNRNGNVSVNMAR